MKIKCLVLPQSQLLWNIWAAIRWVSLATIAYKINQIILTSQRSNPLALQTPPISLRWAKKFSLLRKKKSLKSHSSQQRTRWLLIRTSRMWMSIRMVWAVGLTKKSCTNSSPRRISLRSRVSASTSRCHRIHLKDKRLSWSRARMRVKQSKYKMNRRIAIRSTINNHLIDQRWVLTKGGQLAKTRRDIRGLL